MADRETLDAYSERVEDYRARFASETPEQGMRDFLAALPDGAHILDLGCGPGHALVHLRNAGHDAEGLDALPEFVELARQVSGAPVRHATFAELDAEAVFDGVFANFSLLHAPKSEMSDHLARIAKALKEDGVFHIGLKTGKGERRDGIGRFYSYYETDELRQLLANAGFSIISERTGEDPGLDGTVAPWVVMLCRKTQ